MNYELARKLKDAGWGGAETILMLFIMPISLTIIGFINYGTDAIKDVYVPEIRVYEEISSYINNNNKKDICVK